MAEQTNPSCPHCGKPTKRWSTPRFNVGDGAGWSSLFLYVCFNDECPLYVAGWESMMTHYGRTCSVRYMEDPSSGEKSSIPVGHQQALRGDIIED